MRQWRHRCMVSIMACRLIGAQPLSEPMMTYCWLDTQEKHRWILNQFVDIFIKGNTFGNIVCEKSAILSRPKCVDPVLHRASSLWEERHVNCKEIDRLPISRSLQNSSFDAWKMIYTYRNISHQTLKSRVDSPKKGPVMIFSLLLALTKWVVGDLRRNGSPMTSQQWPTDFKRSHAGATVTGWGAGVRCPRGPGVWVTASVVAASCRSIGTGTTGTTGTGCRRSPRSRGGVCSSRGT